MKTLFIKYIFFLSIFLFTEQYGIAQITMYGAYINITNGANLVINNSATTAITRNGGYIISEGQNNILKWNMGTTTGTYTVPFGYGSNYIPVTFTKSAGTGAGYFAFSTYHTGWQNSASLPTGVANVNLDGNDNSAFVVDRFWSIDAGGYTAKPNLSNLTFSYIDAEHTASGNSIIEAEIGIQRWNPFINDWKDFIPAVTVNTTSNTVSVATVTSTNLWKWWTLPSTSNAHTLPVELTAFTGDCNEGNKIISWSTASEMNSATFTLERSSDAVNWTAVKTVLAAGNSSSIKNYSVTDNANTNTDNYYRLKQTDLDSRIHFFDIIHLVCEGEQPVAALEIYPNPTNGSFFMRNAPEGASVDIINPVGQVVYSEKISSSEQNFNLEGMSKGMYLVAIRNGQKTNTSKLVLQ